ncbi:uncharacterized protein LOC127874998 isoform X2 [Dreissena polymorpha]|uniref:uncharacterized protein LOC127874998 isoform X2 n=1 Tax=Dreissena polymorpha TaxID=45954 RepID=UPI002264270B|nr:uncharacterized protein LOC127874998 isoform X2 [Dreissena polymorpha]
MDITVLSIYLVFICISIFSSVWGQNLLLTSDVSVVAENNPLVLTCVLPAKGANTGWIVNDVRTETALLDDGRCIQPSAPQQGFVYTCLNSTVFTLTIRQVKREQNGDQWKCDSWISGSTRYSNTVNLTVKYQLLTSNVSVVTENNSLMLTCVLSDKGANTGWIVNGIRTQTALLDDGRCIQPSAPQQGFVYTCLNSTVFTLTILHVKRKQNGDQLKCDSWINGVTLYSNNVTLKVQVPISSVSLTDPATDNGVDVAENGTRTFTCQTSGGIPSANVTWYMRNGSSETQILTSATIGMSSSRYTSEDNSYIDTSTMTYTGMRVDNGSRVFCRASNIQDEVNKSTREILLNILLKPDTPKYFFSTNQAATSVMFYWLTVYNGGRSQTFYIEYRKVDSTFWNNVTVDEKKSTSCVMMNLTVNNMSPSTEYQARMYAKSTIGVSQPTEPITFRTLEDRIDSANQKSMSHTGPIVGAVVPGVLLVIVLVGLVFLCLTYNFKKKAPGERRQPKGDQANIIDTSAENAVDSNLYQAKLDHIPELTRDVDLPEMSNDGSPYDYIGGHPNLQPKRALPPTPDSKGGTLTGNVDGGYLTAVDTCTSKSASIKW